MLLSPICWDDDGDRTTEAGYQLLGDSTTLRRQRLPRWLRFLLSLVVLCLVAALAIVARIRLVEIKQLPSIDIQLPVVLSSTDRLSVQHAATLDKEALEIGLKAPKQSMKCKIGPLDEAKYRHLLHSSKDRFYLAANLYNNEEILPNMIQEITELAHLLGPSRLHVSIYENGSTDRTPAYLLLLARRLAWIGVDYEVKAFGQTVPKPHVSRVKMLAEVRNRAMQTLYSLEAGRFSHVIFLNDVAFCARDVLELLLQQISQQADMTCGFDMYSHGKFWELIKYYGFAPAFRDTWVMRMMNGAYFSHNNGSPSKVEAAAHEPTRARYMAGLPFQVFSCWNGMAVMKAQAFQSPYNVRFRSINGTGLASEAYLIGVDLWKNGFKRIMTVPSVRLPYNPKEYIAYNSRDQPNDWKGNRTNLTQTAMEEKIDWVTEPPEKVEWFPYNKYYNHPDRALWFSWEYEPTGLDIAGAAKPTPGDIDSDANE